MAIKVEELQVIVSGDTDPLTKAMNKVTASVQDVSNSIGTNLSAGINKMHNAINTGATVITGGLIAIGAGALKAASDFESMSAALETSFQGNAAAAKAAQDTITKFAAQTPFQLEEVMRGFIKLKNMGLNPSERALRAYGDTASSMGKSLNDMVEAVADAATGEFERLKEFGIRASQQGDKVTFTFKGVSTTVKKNSKDIENYLIKLGETNFSGGMEKQSKTLGGMMSTLKDNFSLALSQMANDSGLLDIAKKAVDGLSSLIASINLKPLFNIIQGIIFYFEEWDIANDLLYEGLVSIFGRDTAKNIISTLIQIHRSVSDFYENGIKPFFQYLQENKDATIAAFVAIGAAILASYIPALFAAVAAAAPLVLTFAAIGAAAFFLYKAWNENWGGMRDKLIQTWEQLQPALAGLWQWLQVNIPAAMSTLAGIYNQFIKPSLDQLWQTIVTKLLPALQQFWQKVGPDIQDAATKAAPYIQAIASFIGGALVLALKQSIDNLTIMIDKFSQFMNFISTNYEKLKSFANLISGIQKADLSQISSSAKALGIPGFRNGVENFGGGLAYVHRGEVLANLPKGTDVIPANQVQNMGGNGDMTMNITVNNNDSRIDGREIGEEIMFKYRMM